MVGPSFRLGLILDAVAVDYLAVLADLEGVEAHQFQEARGGLEARGFSAAPESEAEEAVAEVVAVLVAKMLVLLL